MTLAYILALLFIISSAIRTISTAKYLVEFRDPLNPDNDRKTSNSKPPL